MRVSPNLWQRVREQPYPYEPSVSLRNDIFFAAGQEKTFFFPAGQDRYRSVFGGFWREGWIANKTLQKLAGTNPVIGISSD